VLSGTPFSWSWAPKKPGDQTDSLQQAQVVGGKERGDGTRYWIRTTLVRHREKAVGHYWDIAVGRARAQARRARARSLAEKAVDAEAARQTARSIRLRLRELAGLADALAGLTPDPQCDEDDDLPRRRLPQE
jgi:hypothetical protein